MRRPTSPDKRPRQASAWPRTNQSFGSGDVAVDEGIVRAAVRRGTGVKESDRFVTISPWSGGSNSLPVRPRALHRRGGDRLANACETPTEQLIVWALLDTGLRVSELCTLTLMAYPLRQPLEVTPESPRP